MAVKFTKPEINIREKLEGLDNVKVTHDNMPVGSVLQVVSKVLTNSAHITTTSTSFITMGAAFSLTFSPRKANSKLIFSISMNPYFNSSGAYNIHSGLTGDLITDQAGGLGYMHMGTGYGAVTRQGETTADSTEVRTYTIYARHLGSSGTFYPWHNNTAGHFSIMEVAQ